MYSIKASDFIVLFSIILANERINANVITNNEYQDLAKEIHKRQIYCPKPYHVLTSDNRCVWSCGIGTQPDVATNECVCQVGYSSIGSDQFGRRICSNCPRPYHVLTTDNRCVWSCGTGTQPDFATNECACQVGYYQTNVDQFGRRICTLAP